MRDTVVVQAPSAIVPYSIQQLVVGLELGQTDDQLIAYAQYLTRQIPTTAAHFAHVIPAPQLLEAFYEDLGGRFDVKDSILKNLDQAVAKFFARQQLSPTYGAIEGHPLKELIGIAEQRAADLILIGQKTNTYEHGILAKNLARQSAINTLIVPEAAEVKISKILVPIDFSPNSVKAFQTAFSLKQRLGDQVQLSCLNVFDMPNLSAYNVGRSPQKFKEWIVASRQEAFENFFNAYAPQQEDQIPGVLIERQGPGLSNYILNYAKENDFDLIAIGAKGHSSLERLLMGSVTEKLLTINETIPTLVIK
ncbi:MAG: universal stress protein [Saprospiraceae bacterium]|nr:universal stress protein [Saprospiraceae bacterium]